MMIPPVPEIPEIKGNLDQWKAFLIETSKRIEIVEKEHKKTQEQLDAVATMRDMFQRYVTPVNSEKVFCPDMVQVNRADSYSYSHSKVYMSYLGRQTWCLDDYDFFIDRYITINDKVVLNQHKA